MNKKSCNQEFGKKLRELRLKQSLTVREFAAKSKCAFNYITMIENAHWGCGAGVLGRMAEALNLEGWERKEFLLAGLTTSKIHPLLPEVEAYHPTIINALGLWLKEQGIAEDECQHCTLLPKGSSELPKRSVKVKRGQNWQRATKKQQGELAAIPFIRIGLVSGKFAYVTFQIEVMASSCVGENYGNI